MIIESATTLILLMITVGGVAMTLGYWIAKARWTQKTVHLSSQLEQSQSTLTSANEKLDLLQTQLTESESDLNSTKLAESRLKEQLLAAQSNEHRANKEIESLKAERSGLSARLDEERQKCHTSEKAYESAQTECRGFQEQIVELKDRLTRSEVTVKEARAKIDALREQYHRLSAEHTELSTTLARREEHFKEQMVQLSDTKQSLSKEFENIANKIFEDKGKTFSQTSQASIDHLLKPFREQIEGFQKRVNEVHDASLKGNTSLNAEIKKVLDIGLQMSKEANNLTSALKGDSQQRGAWGEAQLRRTLEMSGLIEEAHYEVQSAFKDAEGKQKQTDYLIKLPDGKHIIIDSKVSLIAYDRAVGAETPEALQIAMHEHANAVKRHIDDLASKDYTNLIGVRSPNFVLMFMPIEPAYIEALKHQKDLFEYGYKKGVVLVSHTTLIPILRTVSNLWMIERSNTEAREISEKAGDIFNQVCTVAERLGKLGHTLGTVSKHYNSTVTALAGQQGLYGKVDRFSQLSAKVSKSLPQLEPAHMDFEQERLSMIVEPVEGDVLVEAESPGES